jgi:hypothetical protein
VYRQIPISEAIKRIFGSLFKLMLALCFSVLLTYVQSAFRPKSGMSARTDFFDPCLHSCLSPGCYQPGIPWPICARPPIHVVGLVCYAGPVQLDHCALVESGEDLAASRCPEHGCLEEECMEIRSLRVLQSVR